MRLQISNSKALWIRECQETVKKGSHQISAINESVVWPYSIQWDWINASTQGPLLMIIRSHLIYLLSKNTIWSQESKYLAITIIMVRGPKLLLVLMLICCLMRTIDH